MTAPSFCLPVAAILLAAGEGKRMGKPKQLLPFGQGTLLTHAVDTALEAGFAPLLVVVGAQADAVQASIASKPVEIVQNQHWNSGMGSSIVAGVNHLQEMGADSAAVAVLLGDQPLITAAHFAEMRTLLVNGNASVVVAEYNGTLGVPAIFKRHLFSHLASLNPEAGAKTLLLDSGLKVAPYKLPEAAVDIDTPEDFTAL